MEWTCRRDMGSGKAVIQHSPNVMGHRNYGSGLFDYKNIYIINPGTYLIIITSYFCLNNSLRKLHVEPSLFSFRSQTKPVGLVRLFANYTISLSSLCRLIWRHWTTRMLVMYMMPSVCLRLRQFSQLFLFNICGCVSSAYPILLWWSWECVLYLIFIIKPEVWIINQC